MHIFDAEQVLCIVLNHHTIIHHPSLRLAPKGFDMLFWRTVLVNLYICRIKNKVVAFIKHLFFFR